MAAKKPVPPIHPSGVTPGFAVEMWPLERIQRYPGNPRRNEAAVAKVADSIGRFGWQQPIVVDGSGVIIVGDTRLLAAQLRREAVAPVHVAVGLTPAQVRAYRLADNRLHEEAEWDDDQLLRELQALERDGVALAATGFEEDELVDLLGPGHGLQPHADPEAVPPLPAEPVSKLGQLYRCGDHLVLCGDATHEVAWARLLGGAPADMLWTDPPYDVNYEGRTTARLSILNDSLGHSGTVKMLRAALTNAIRHLAPGSPMYVCAPHGPQFWAFAKVGVELDWWRSTILWIKDSFAFGRSDYHYRHEAIVVGEAPGLEPTFPLGEAPLEVESVGYGWVPGKAHRWFGGRKLDTGWEVDRPRVNDDHPTAKPVELVERAIRASSAPGDVVVDCFGGGGSCLIACEVTLRKARIIELDPRFIDVILRRWAEATGRTPELLEDTGTQGVT